MTICRRPSLLLCLFYVIPTVAWVLSGQSSRLQPLRLSSSSNPEDLLKQAEKLRKQVDEIQKQKQQVEQEENNRLKRERQAQQAQRERYTAVVPILKPDGSLVEERCVFSPRYQDSTSFITTLLVELPIGVILGESEDFAGAIVVDEVAEGSNGESGGVLVGDLVRACTACKFAMEQPAWQLIAGGIGIPRTKRFMYSADNRPFEEVLDVVSSNRMDPEGRPVLLVIERQEK